MFGHRMGSLLLVLLAALVAPARVAPARAATLDLTPASSAVAIRVYGLGLLPFDGNYTRFHGELTYDPANRTACQVTLTIDTDSLTMPDLTLRATVVGPDFLDAARYPTLRYIGACRGGELDGALTMHGVTRPLALTLNWQLSHVTAMGRLERSEWGMSALPFAGGRTVRITVAVVLPPAGTTS